MKIQVVNKKNKRGVDLFVKREWKRFDEERGYRWGEEKKYKFVMLENKTPIGFMSFKIRGGAAFLSELIVAKAFRNKGIGSLLIRKFEELAKKKRCHVAYLETSEKHKEAIKFYKKHGYRIIAELKNNKFHLNWYYMSKELS